MLFVMPNAVPDSPASERISAFKRYYENRGEACNVLSSPEASVWSIFNAARREKTVFLSMPAFRRWWLFLIPGVRVILDIRDGWSIAISSGYGGITQAKPFKAFVAKLIERLAIKRSLFTITCTPGLRDYLEKVSGRDIVLITNGVGSLTLDSLSDDVVPGKHANSKLDREGAVTLCCAGKFSEYGETKAKAVIDCISGRYSHRGFVIKIYGADPELNSWAVDYTKQV